MEWLIGQLFRTEILSGKLPPILEILRTLSNSFQSCYLIGTWMPSITVCCSGDIDSFTIIEENVIFKVWDCIFCFQVFGYLGESVRSINRVWILSIERTGKKIQASKLSQKVITRLSSLCSIPSYGRCPPNLISYSASDKYCLHS